MSAFSKERGVSRLTLSLVVAGVMLVLLGTLLLIRHLASPRPETRAGARTALTPEQTAYLPSIEISDVHMSAAQNFLGDTVTMLDARVSNRGNKEIRRLDLELVFFDTLNQVILRETARPITERAAPLKPGETRPFHLTFEQIPPDWNQAAPFIRPTSVKY